MPEILLISFLILIIITVFYLIGMKNKQQTIQTYSIPFFIKSYSNLIDKEDNTQDKSLIEKLNDFFNDSNKSDANDENGEMGDNDDGDE